MAFAATCADVLSAEAELHRDSQHRPSHTRGPAASGLLLGGVFLALGLGGNDDTRSICGCFALRLAAVAQRAGGGDDPGDASEERNVAVSSSVRDEKAQRIQDCRVQASDRDKQGSEHVACSKRMSTGHGCKGRDSSVHVLVLTIASGLLFGCGASIWRAGCVSAVLVDGDARLSEKREPHTHPKLDGATQTIAPPPKHMRARAHIHTKFTTIIDLERMKG